MKKIKKAFSYAEIITVVVIIGIVSSFGVVSFFDFMKNREIEYVTNQIVSILEDEDKKINNKEIFDYSINFNTNNKNNFIINENIYDLDNYISLNNGNIALNGDSDNIEKFELSILENGKLIFSGKGDFNKNKFDFKELYDYKINGILTKNGKKITLNNIQLIKIDEKSSVKLSKIETGNNNQISNLDMKNIGGKKGFYNSDNLLETNEIKLFFEKDGKENFIILNL